MPLPTDAAPLDVEILYMSAWDHAFFGFVDGPVQQFKVGTAPLNADGRFQIAIPDFSKDAVTAQMPGAYLGVRLVAHSGGNLVQWVLPSAGELRMRLYYGPIGNAASKEIFCVSHSPGAVCRNRNLLPPAYSGNLVRADEDPLSPQ
jgi:hypothetical protein